MSNNNQASWSLNGLGAAFEKNKKENDSIFHQIGSSMNMMMKELQGQEDLFTFTLSKILETLDLKEHKEISYSAEDFDKRFKPMFGIYFHDVEFKSIVKVDLITKGYKLTSSKEVGESENMEYIYSHPENGDKSIFAKDPYEALQKFKEWIRHPIILTTV
jgi:hypothetical protein